MKKLWDNILRAQPDYPVLYSSVFLFNIRLLITIATAEVASVLNGKKKRKSSSMGDSRLIMFMVDCDEAN